MQINSPEGMLLAARMFRESGRDWDRVRQASTVSANGVRVIDRNRLAALLAQAEAR